jgi:ATP-dependent RNA helicase DeaD
MLVVGGAEVVLQGFIELGLNPRVLRALEAMGFEEPTPVQMQTIPHLLAGKDVIVQAQTGSGKTAAYGIPIAETVDPLQAHIQALVLSPTRELALQVSVHLSHIGQFQELSVVPVYGGQSYDHQIRALRRGAQIVVATPGRLLDLLERRALSLADVCMVVLDEADEMLDMGFLDDVESILRQTPQERQTALFSATMPQDILRLASSYMRQPEHITLSQTRTVTVPTVEQSYYVVPRSFKVESLMRLLDVASPQLALIFCATKQMTSDLARELQGRGYRSEALHGDMTQAQRESVMQASRAGRIEALVATDVAARGLDIPEVSHVFNFDIPQDPDRYVHRIGRTARAGRAGEAITIIAPREFSLLQAIERAIGTRIQRRELPTVAELEKQERANMIAQVERALTEDQWSSFRPLVEDLAQRHDLLDLAAAALSQAFGPTRPRQEIPRVTAEKETTRRRPGRAPKRGFTRAAGKGSRDQRNRKRT